MNNESGIIQNNGGTFTNTNQGQINNAGKIESTSPIYNIGNGTIDTTQGVLSGNVIGGLDAEASWEVNGEKYYGSLEKAIEAVTDTEEAKITLMGNPVIIDENVSIPNNATLKVPNNTSLEITGTLENKGKIEVMNGRERSPLRSANSKF